MKTCIACSMPMEMPEDFGNGNTDSESCVHCTNIDGGLKSCDAIYNGGVEFFVTHVTDDNDMTEKLTRYNMKKLPHWKENTCDCFKGETITDEEYQKCLSDFEDQQIQGE